MTLTRCGGGAATRRPEAPASISTDAISLSASANRAPTVCHPGLQAPCLRLLESPRARVVGVCARPTARLQCAGPVTSDPCVLVVISAQPCMALNTQSFPVRNLCPGVSACLWFASRYRRAGSPRGHQIMYDAAHVLSMSPSNASWTSSVSSPTSRVGLGSPLHTRTPGLGQGSCVCSRYVCASSGRYYYLTVPVNSGLCIYPEAPDENGMDCPEETEGS